MKGGGYDTLAKSLLAALCAALISGCTLLSPVENEIRVEMIDKLPLAIPQRETHAATLLVLPPAINPAYDTVRMIYRVRPHQIDYFSKHEWGASPAEMLLPLLARTLERTHYFDAVITPPYFGPYSYALRTEILELTQDFTSDPATLHLSLRVQLTDGASNRIISTRAISLREPMLQNTPYAGVVAANDASVKALQQVAGFVLETVQ
ncbi:ABC-type transport auxiliary lipoprotein family protein [Microbulbifer marinus]|uniref:Cholesterol transport system auxiliary component n=1 Tax=Microbulbifer marinus TaxID=658218 RepID=A0A1H3W3A8_9GAMM|nr:ABC-type transport auxiliary lipoprotein family protein [Microbulbifer marinus]SDZ81553.1 cholesterol transport system auxiliary component [Microbulbifer marinus]